MNKKAVPLIKLTVTTAIITSVCAIAGPIPLKLYFLSSAIGYHIHAIHKNKIHLIPLSVFCKKETVSTCLILDWRKR